VDAGDESGFRRYGRLSGKASRGGGVGGRLTFFSGQGHAVSTDNFDLFVACDFPDNTADAERVVREGCRMLRSGGFVLLAATRETGGELSGLAGLLPFLEKAGLQDVKVCFYWSEVYGHLGDNQFYVTARVP
jgi:hypothetical protein